MASVESGVVVGPSVTISVGSRAVGSVDTGIFAKWAGVSAAVVIAVVVVLWGISEVSSDSSNSSVSISVVGEGVVRGEVIGVGVAVRVVRGGVSLVDWKGFDALVSNALDGGLDLSGGTSGKLGGGFKLGAVGSDAKECSAERFHCEL